ncbi:peptidase inhibitor I78 family protein [Shimia isoporae]|uniref:Peptidase inhibitor I78 family protein n=1 Tax=Shimia isoporae TaxID=647720 RepID=A0A4R1NID4_9RHOB|nr:I78 family peptidase inhibitor [Shimia isoporae]TCL07977.1 peptidase inhibitor I78 family protein [Shimia isoporae]
MGIKTWVVALASVVTVAACLGEEEDTVSKGSETCDPATFEFLIGQDVSALEGVTVPEMVRVMEDNSPATMDFHENRLNVIHDADGKILAVRCG